MLLNYIKYQCTNMNVVDAYAPLNNINLLRDLNAYKSKVKQLQKHVCQYF